MSVVTARYIRLPTLLPPHGTRRHSALRGLPPPAWLPALAAAEAAVTGCVTDALTGALTGAHSHGTKRRHLVRVRACLELG